MTLRLSIIAIVLVFLNTILGCTRMAVRPPEDIIEHPEIRIHSAALLSSYPFAVELKDVALVRFKSISQVGEIVPLTDTVTPDAFKKEASQYKVIKIEGITLKSGKEINIENRKSSYEEWADLIVVAGNEIVFKDSGACFDPVEGLLRGQIYNGDSVTVKVEDIAYIRRQIKDYVETFFFVGGLIATFILSYNGLSSM